MPSVLTTGSAADVDCISLIWRFSFEDFLLIKVIKCFIIPQLIVHHIHVMVSNSISFINSLKITVNRLIPCKADWFLAKRCIMQFDELIHPYSEHLVIFFNTRKSSEIFWIKSWIFITISLDSSSNYLFDFFVVWHNLPTSQYIACVI